MKRFDMEAIRHYKRLAQSTSLVFYFIFILNLVAISFIYITDINLGDALGDISDIGDGNKLSTGIAVLLSYVLVYKAIPKKHVNISAAQYKSALNSISIVLMAGVLIGGLGFVFFDYGVAEKQSNAALGFIFKILPYDAAFTLLLCVMPFEKKYFALIFGYAILRLLMGWTGFIAGFFFIVFMRLYAQKTRSRFAFFIALLLMLLLFLLAPYVYSIKFYFRYGEWLDINYLTSLGMLLGRITAYGNAFFVANNTKELIEAVDAYGSIVIPFLDPILAVLPRAALGINVQPLETILVNVISGDFNPGIVFYLTAVGKVVSIYTYSPILALLWMIESFVLLKILFYLIIRLCGANGIYACLMAALGFALSGSLEEIGYGIYGMFVLNLVSVLMKNLYWLAPVSMRYSHEH